jgi:proline iminopeptidase
LASEFAWTVDPRTTDRAYLARETNTLARSAIATGTTATYAEVMPHAKAVFLVLAACDVESFDTLVAPTVDDDPSLPALELNGTRLHVESFGPDDAPVMIFLHGGPGGDFRYALPLVDPDVPGALVADHRVVMWDQRGTGLSRRHDRDDVSIDHYFRDLVALVDAVSPHEPVVLVGHSWGGAYAAWYLANHPDRVAGAVLIHPQALTHALSVEAGPAADTEVLAEWLADPLWQRTLISPADHARADFLLGALELYRIPRFHNDAIAATFRPGAVVFRDLAFRWFEDTPYDFTSGLAAFPRPIRVLAGSDDEVLGHAFQTKQMPLFGDAELVMLQGDGHNDPVSSSAARTVAEIRRYLEAL